MVITVLQWLGKCFTGMWYCSCTLSLWSCFRPAVQVNWNKILKFPLLGNSSQSSAILSRAGCHGKALARQSKEFFFYILKVRVSVLLWLCGAGALWKGTGKGIRKTINLRTSCNITLRKRCLKLWVKKLPPAVCFLKRAYSIHGL